MELLEAEGRTLRQATARLGWTCALIGLTILLAGTGAALLLWALYHGLAAALGTTAGAAITGVVALLAAGLCAVVAERTIRSR